MARDRSGPDAVRITTAGANRHEEIAARQKRYLISMSLRSLCFIGAIVAFLLGVGWLWPLLIAGALVLPYVAVVMANAVHTQGDGFELVGHTGQHPELTSGSDRGRLNR